MPKKASFCDTDWFPVLLADRLKAVVELCEDGLVDHDQNPWIKEQSSIRRFPLTRCLPERQGGPSLSGAAAR